MRAFALPTDQHGWIRVNLVGREARGTVPGVLYDEVCNELENELQNLRSDRGVSLVDRVIRVARNAEAASVQRLHLVVHWTDEVFAKPLRIEGSAVKAESIGKK